MTIIADSQKALAAELAQLGQIPEDEAKEWLVNRGLDEHQATKVINSAPGGRRLWIKRDGFLVPKSQVQSEGNSFNPSPINDGRDSDVSNLSDVNEQLTRLAISLGIGKERAEAAANFVADTADVYDAESLWSSLQSTDFSPVQRKRFYIAWISKMGIESPPSIRDHLAKVQDSGSFFSPGPAQNASAFRTALYVVVNGEPFPTRPDDPMGVSFVEAMKIAELQIQNVERKRQSMSPGPSQDVSLAETIFHENAETERVKLEIASQKPADELSTGKLVLAVIESQRKEADAHLDGLRRESEAKLELVRERSESALALIREQMATQTRQLTDAIERLTTKLTEEPKNPFGVLGQLFPGMGEKLVQRLLEAPQQSSVFSLKLPEGGDITTGHLDILKGLNDMQMQKNWFGLMREYVPEFLTTAKDFAQAIREEAASRGLSSDTVAQEQKQAPTPTFNTTQCIGCGLATLGYRSDQSMFQCPKCGTVQTPEGDLVKILIHKKSEQSDTPGTRPPDQEIPLSAPSEPEFDPASATSHIPNQSGVIEGLIVGVKES